MSPSYPCIARFIFSSFSISGSQALVLRKLKRKRKESIRIGETEGALTVMAEKQLKIVMFPIKKIIVKNIKLDS